MLTFESFKNSSKDASNLPFTEYCNLFDKREKFYKALKRVFEKYDFSFTINKDKTFIVNGLPMYIQSDNNLYLIFQTAKPGFPNDVLDILNDVLFREKRFRTVQETISFFKKYLPNYTKKLSTMNSVGILTETIDAIIDDVFKTYDDLKRDSMQDALVQALIHEMKSDTGALEIMVGYYLGENPEKRNELDSLNEREIAETSDFLNWLEEDLKYKYDDFMRLFKNLKNPDNSVTIYRIMKVKESWKKKLLKNEQINLGIYWSYEEDAAEAHWGHNISDTIEVFIEARVDFDKINWYQTMFANLQPSTGDEKEIRLPKDVVLNVQRINDFDFNKNIVFKS